MAQRKKKYAKPVPRLTTESAKTLGKNSNQFPEINKLAIYDSFVHERLKKKDTDLTDMERLQVQAVRDFLAFRKSKT